MTHLPAVCSLIHLTPRRLLILLTALVTLGACVDDADVAIPQLRLDGRVTAVTAYNEQDGAIDLTVEGGTPPYVFNWNTGAQTEDLSAITAGTYAVTVVDAASTVAEGTFAVTQPGPAPLVVTFTVSDASRYGASDADCSTTVSGGTPPYAYAWSNGTTTANLNGVPAGTYRLTVTDAGVPAQTTIDSVVIRRPAFVCGRDSLRDADGHLYATVDIGGRCWTAANLRTRTHPKHTGQILEGVFCDNQNCGNERGAHYDWATATIGGTNEDGVTRGVCPCEWHLPTKAEWDALVTWLSSEGNGGPGRLAPPKLRGAGSSSGFDALYAGNWGFPILPGDRAAFWTAGSANAATATYRIITPNLPIVGGGETGRQQGLSVRCVRD